MKKEWTIKAIVFCQNKKGKKIEKTIGTYEKYYTEADAKERIDEMEIDLYGYEIPVRLGGIVIRPSENNSILSPTKMVQIKKFGSDDVVLTFYTKKI